MQRMVATSSQEKQSVWCNQAKIILSGTNTSTTKACSIPEIEFSQDSPMPSVFHASEHKVSQRMSAITEEKELRTLGEVQKKQYCLLT